MLRLIQWLKPVAGYILTFLIIAVITVSSIPSLQTPKLHSGRIEIRLDYLFHILEYGGLSFFAFLTFAEGNFSLTCKKYLLITICLIAFCIADEFHQKLIPGKTFNVNDILSNIIGVLTALGFSFVAFRIINNKKLNPSLFSSHQVKIN